MNQLIFLHHPAIEMVLERSEELDTLNIICLSSSELRKQSIEMFKEVRHELKTNFDKEIIIIRQKIAREVRKLNAMKKKIYYLKDRSEDIILKNPKLAIKHQTLYEQNDTKFLQFKKSFSQENNHIRDAPILSIEERLKSNQRIYEKF